MRKYGSWQQTHCRMKINNLKNLNVCKIEFAMNSLNLTPTTFYLGADSFFYMIGFGSDFDSQTIF